MHQIMSALSLPCADIVFHLFHTEGSVVVAVVKMSSRESMEPGEVWAYSSAQVETQTHPDSQPYSLLPGSCKGPYYFGEVDVMVTFAWSLSEIGISEAEPLTMS